MENHYHLILETLHGKRASHQQNRERQEMHISRPDPSLEEVDPLRPVVLAQDVAREGENTMILMAEDLLAAKPTGFRNTLLVASANSRILEGKIITKRGYDSKYCY